MVLLIAFAFVAGVGTALSPCVLPVLPIALSAGATGGSRRPLGIVVGLAVTFTFATRRARLCDRRAGPARRPAPQHRDRRPDRFRADADAAAPLGQGRGVAQPPQ